MPPRRLLAAGCVALALGAVACESTHVLLPRAADPLSELELGPGERLLVMVPHPDDEVLCCSGLIARVLGKGGSVHLVYATHGDGYREGVAVEMREPSPGPETFRADGERRHRESLTVLGALSIPERQARFLGFPDGGLRALWDHRFDDALPTRRPARALTYLVHWRTWPDAPPDPTQPLAPPEDLEAAIGTGSPLGRYLSD